MTSTLLLPTDPAIESIAFAGTDLPVHLIVSHSSGTAQRERRLLVVDYPSFSRLLRNRIPRKQAIDIMSRLGARPVEDPRTGLRNWIQIHLENGAGQAVRIDATSQRTPSPLAA